MVWLGHPHCANHFDPFRRCQPRRRRHVSQTTEIIKLPLVSRVLQMLKKSFAFMHESDSYRPTCVSLTDRFISLKVSGGLFWSWTPHHPLCASLFHAYINLLLFHFACNRRTNIPAQPPSFNSAANMTGQHFPQRRVYNAA
jgi:hypothetical protein